MKPLVLEVKSVAGASWEDTATSLIELANQLDMQVSIHYWRQYILVCPGDDPTKLTRAIKAYVMKEGVSVISASMILPPEVKETPTDAE